MPVVIIADAGPASRSRPILLLAALLTVPSELKEAASVDGASRPAVFWHITLPWIRPVLFVVVVLRLHGRVPQVRGHPAADQGGPGLASTPINLQIYNTGLFYNRVGYAAAWGLVMVAHDRGVAGARLYLVRRTVVSR